MQGMLLVDKPAGWTSFDVVNYVRRIVATIEGKKPKNCKVGHSGTLDPFATGLLILLIGKEYTKRASELSRLDKTYEVTMKLGVTSTTGDPEGKISDYVRVGGLIVKPTRETIDNVAKRFVGEIQQVPPAYSAIKVNGQRAYKLARAGKEVIIESRKITINRLEVTSYNYPEVKFIADVSSGTYIRTLSEDIGKALDTGAYTSQLRRTSVGKFKVGDAIETTAIDENSLKTCLSTLA